MVPPVTLPQRRAALTARPQSLLPDGVFPTMITPFTADRKVDYAVLEKLIEWYIASGCTGA